MKRMYIILFVLNNSAFRRNVNESIELWLTHSGQKKAKEPKQDQPQCNKEQARDASLQQSKHISWFGWSKGGNDQTIICYKKVCVSNRISMENDYLCFCVWVTSTAAQSQTNCFELNTSTRLHIIECDAKRCNECSNSSVVLFVIVAAIDDYIPKINTILAALNFIFFVGDGIHSLSFSSFFLFICHCCHCVFHMLRHNDIHYAREHVKYASIELKKYDSMPINCAFAPFNMSIWSFFGRYWTKRLQMIAQLMMENASL